MSKWWKILLKTVDYDFGEEADEEMEETFEQWNDVDEEEEETREMG